MAHIIKREAEVWASIIARMFMKRENTAAIAVASDVAQDVLFLLLADSTILASFGTTIKLKPFTISTCGCIRNGVKYFQTYANYQMETKKNFGMVSAIATHEGVKSLDVYADDKTTSVPVQPDQIPLLDQVKAFVLFDEAVRKTLGKKVTVTELSNSSTYDASKNNGPVFATYQAEGTRRVALLSFAQSADGIVQEMKVGFGDVSMDLKLPPMARMPKSEIPEGEHAKPESTTTDPIISTSAAPIVAANPTQPISKDPITAKISLPITTGSPRTVIVKPKTLASSEKHRDLAKDEAVVADAKQRSSPTISTTANSDETIRPSTKPRERVEKKDDAILPDGVKRKLSVTWSIAPTTNPDDTTSRSTNQKKSTTVDTPITKSRKNNSNFSALVESFNKNPVSSARSTGPRIKPAAMTTPSAPTAPLRTSIDDINAAIEKASFKEKTTADPNTSGDQVMPVVTTNRISFSGKVSALIQKFNRPLPPQPILSPRMGRITANNMPGNQSFHRRGF